MTTMTTMSKMIRSPKQTVALNSMNKSALKDAKGCMLATEFLGGRIAAVLEDRNLRADIVAGQKGQCIDIKSGKDRFRVMAAYRKGKYTGYSVIFDMNKIREGGYITLQVSNEDVKKSVIGTGGENVRNWCKELKVEKITVICPE